MAGTLRGVVRRRGDLSTCSAFGPAIEPWRGPSACRSLEQRGDVRRGHRRRRQHRHAGDLRAFDRQHGQEFEEQATQAGASATLKACSFRGPWRPCRPDSASSRRHVAEAAAKLAGCDADHARPVSMAPAAARLRGQTQRPRAHQPGFGRRCPEEQARFRFNTEAAIFNRRPPGGSGGGPEVRSRHERSRYAPSARRASICRAARNSSSCRLGPALRLPHRRQALCPPRDPAGPTPGHCRTGREIDPRVHGGRPDLRRRRLHRPQRHCRRARDPSGHVVLERYGLGLQAQIVGSTMSTVKSMTAMLVGAAVQTAP